MDNTKTTAPAPMSAKERSTLIDIVKARARYLKGELDVRGRVVLADAERQLSAEFTAEDAAWTEAVQRAKQAVEDADRVIAEASRAMGIRDEFRPSVHLNFYGRGTNSFKDRRAELRTLARANVEASVREQKHVVDGWQLDMQTRLLADGLESSEARAFLESLPSVEALLPPMTLSQIDALTSKPGLRLVGDATGTYDGDEGR